jgi:hypothetical protein
MRSVARVSDIVRMLTISDIFAALIEHRHYKSYVNGEAVNQIVCEGVVVDPPKHRASFATG